VSSSCCAVAGSLSWLAATGATAATLPPGFSETRIVSGLVNATAMAFTPDGRLLVCEQEGRLRVVKGGRLLARPFLSVPVDASGERGLLGVAVDPDFADNGFVYVYYTATTPTTHNRVSRFTAKGDVGAGETVILELNDLTGATNHNGGALHFGPDGMLYVAVGDNANGGNSQSLSTLLGKILRLTPDGTIPPDNPFVDITTGANRAIWALGLRNPFTFAFQPGSGRMLINDVGEVSWEEVNEGLPGANYGWPRFEGPASDPSFQAPLHAYAHGFTATTGCAITGGTFYDPPTAQFPPEYVGSYFFADFCTGWIRRLNPPARGRSVSAFASGISLPVDLRVGADGALYYLARGAGSVFRVQFADNAIPEIVEEPVARTVAPGQPAMFRVAVSGTHPIEFQWRRDGVEIAGATSTTLTLPSVAPDDAGSSFEVTVTNPLGSAVSSGATLT
jgi:glucose/arabinose dehydrogenase